VPAKASLTERTGATQKASGGVAPVQTAHVPSVFVVIPAHNEVGALPGVLDELSDILSRVSRRHLILVVDDGSTDGTPQLLRQLATEKPSIAALELVRRTGKSTAVQAGLDRIPDWADIVVLMDGDGQDDPNDLPMLIAPLVDGEADMSLGWRRKRAENLVRTVPSRVANKMLASATGVPIHDFNSGLKVLRADVARTLQLRGDMHRFIPALGALAGARIVEFPVIQRPRETGRSKYGLGRTGKVFLDMIGLYFILRFADRPIRLFGTIGVWFLVIGLVILAYLGIDRIFFNVPVLSRPFFLVSIFLLLCGVIVIMNGLTAELLAQSIFRRDKQTRGYTARSLWGEPLDGSEAEEAPAARKPAAVTRTAPKTTTAAKASAPRTAAATKTASASKSR
jgi:glycosyltransferase involved in cell wall biosynthesis